MSTLFTYFGKFLVLLNAFTAVAVLAWAAAVFFTRVDAADAVDTSGEKLTDKVKRLQDRAVKVQAGYPDELKAVADADARLFALRANIAKRLDQSEKGKFYDIYGPRAADPTNPNAVSRVGAYYWGDEPAREVKALDGKPLGGVDQMRKNLIDEQTAATTHIDGIEKSVKAMTVLNGEIDALNARYAWLDERMKKHEAELPALADLRVNWENRSGSLQRRRNQLILRLEDLKGAKVGAVAPAPTGPSAFAATPNNK